MIGAVAYGIAAYCILTIISNVATIAYISGTSIRDGSPTPHSWGAWWHLVSNASYVLPYIPYALVTRPAEQGGLDGSGRERADLLMRYVALVAISSSLHHAFELESSPVYAGTGIPLLARAVDWSIARLSGMVGIHCAIGIEDFLEVARPIAEHWLFHICILSLSSILMTLAVMNDMRYVASGPFLETSVLGSVVAGALAAVLPMLIVVCLGGRRVALVALRHYVWSRQGALGTLSLLTSLGAAVSTRVEEDDVDGTVHALWHLATAGILGSTMVLIFDKDVHVGQPLHPTDAARTMDL